MSGQFCHEYAVFMEAINSYCYSMLYASVTVGHMSVVMYLTPVLMQTTVLVVWDTGRITVLHILATVANMSAWCCRDKPRNLHPRG